MSKGKHYKNIAKDGEVADSENEASFLNDKVGKSGGEHIEKCFETLVLKKGDRPFDWYQSEGISLDKSEASKIRRGLLIPPLWLRLKISKYFGCDSTMIWRIEDMDYIKEVLKQQKRRIRDNDGKI